MRATAMAIGVLAAVAGGLAAAEPAKDWPCWRGADGSGSLSFGLKLVDDMNKMKLVWESQEQEIPSSYNVIMGGAAGPVFANGKVYVNYCQPSGQVVAEGYYKALLGEKTPEEIVQARQRRSKGYNPVTKPEDIRRRCLVNADDVTLCIDAATGRTLWKAIFPDAGLNPSMQVRGWPSAKMGPHCLPAVAYGKVVTIGSIGLVHCVDARDGKPLWEYKLSVYATNQASKEKTLAAKGMPHWSDPRLSPSFADGVFVVPDGGKLIGLDPEKGTKLWETPVSMGESAPIRWACDGKEYVIARDTCIEPKTGKMLWRAAGAVHGGGTAVVGEGYLVFGGSGEAKTGKAVGFNAYKITPQGAAKAWESDAEFSGGSHCSSVIMGGHLYGRVSGDRGLCCINLATGKVVGHANIHTDTAGSLVGADGRIYWNGMWFDADPKSFRVLNGDMQKNANEKFRMGDDASYALSASCTPCIVDGRLYVRGQHTVLCFDLRQ